MDARLRGWRMDGKSTAWESNLCVCGWIGHFNFAAGSAGKIIKFWVYKMGMRVFVMANVSIGKRRTKWADNFWWAKGLLAHRMAIKHLWNSFFVSVRAQTIASRTKWKSIDQFCSAFESIICKRHIVMRWMMTTPKRISRSTRQTPR